MKHGERKHSKFSASGAERWVSCAGSVALSEGIESKSSIWSLEGTQAHEVLEHVMRARIQKRKPNLFASTPSEMVDYANATADFVFDLYGKDTDSELLLETRVALPFIHKDMFGTLDIGVVVEFDTLHVIDYKYGKGVPVSPEENLQMIIYGLGAGAVFGWNFSKVRLWIEQPRIKGYDGPLFWKLSMKDLRSYIPFFQKAVKRALTEPESYSEGSWCHWCPAKAKCPLKTTKRLGKAKNVFANVPLQ